VIWSSVGKAQSPAQFILDLFPSMMPLASVGLRVSMNFWFDAGYKATEHQSFVKTVRFGIRFTVASRTCLHIDSIFKWTSKMVFWM
jgi:hypothetical protein